MERAYFIGLDIAKNVFQVCLADKGGKQISNKKLRRGALIPFFANLPQASIGIEACGTAHYWARKLQELGHDVKLIQPIRVKAFLGNHSKTDAADARAICEALMHPGTRFVAIKTEQQQDMDHLLCMRETMIETRTMLINQTRSFLAERGIIVAKGANHFKNEISPILAAHWEEFGCDFQIVLTENIGAIEDISQKIESLDQMLTKRAKEIDECRKLMSIKGIGVLTALTLLIHVGDISKFKNGRQMAAYFGLTPKEYSSGGKQRYLGISKHGSKRLRTLMILAARAVINGIDRRKKDEQGQPMNMSNLDRWVISLRSRIGIFKTTVALANKLVRIAWAVLANGDLFNPTKACLHTAS